MRSARWLLLLLPLFAPGAPVEGQPSPKPADPPAPAGYHRVTLGKHTFTLPKGFTIELVAESPQVERPVVASFDGKGRLFVADSSGDNSKPADQLKNPTHRVVMLESTKKDGKFDKSTVFADKLSFLQGCLWHNGSLYVATPPTIQKLTDTDDDGKADKRETWFDGGVLTGCANDVHGPYPGPDGRLYWTKGAFAKQQVVLRGGKTFTTRAAHIYRAKPDGSEIEVVMTGGMDNPVDVAFTPAGETFFTTTFFQHPANGKRDGIVHATYGAVYGKDHDVVADQPWAYPTLNEPMTHLGPAAPSGLHCYRSGAFGEDYSGNLFVAQFNLAKVSRHVLKPHGSTYRTEDSDFVVSDNRDFHPTDVIEDADGSLLVIDTGGWYKLCCPSSVMEKKDVLGAIYRVRLDHQKPGGRAARKPVDWKKVSTNGLVYGFLRDGAYALRRDNDWAPFAELASRGKEAVEGMTELLNDPNADNEHTWHVLLAVAADINSPEARGLVRKVLGEIPKKTLLGADVQSRIHLAAVRTAGLVRDKGAVELVLKGLEHKSLVHRRVAAEALGRIGDETAIPAILDALGSEPMDVPLQTALTRALIDIGDPVHVKAGLKRGGLANLAALIALSQIDPKSLKFEEVLQPHHAVDPVRRRAAVRIAKLDPKFSELLGWRAWLDGDDETLLLCVHNHAVLDGIVKYLTDDSRPLALDRCQQLLALLTRAKMPAPPESAKQLIRQLSVWKSHLADVALAAKAMGAEKWADDDLKKALAAVAKDDKQSDAVRLSALSVTPKAMDDTLFAFTLERLKSTQPAALRGLAAEVLGKADLSAKQLTAVVEAIPTASPLDLDRLLGLFARSTDEAVGRALVKALSEPKVRAATRAEQVKPILSKYPKGVQAEAEKLYTVLKADRAELTKKLDAVLKEAKPGDVRRGQAVFNSTKAACVTCHKVAYVGGAVGPDLTKIGSIRSERELLEAVMFPSASFVRSYEPYKVETKDGKSFNGILKKDAPDEVVLAVNATEEVRISRPDVDELKPGTASVMPAGLDQQLTPQELADLVAFLRSLK